MEVYDSIKSKIPKVESSLYIPQEQSESLFVQKENLNHKKVMNDFECQTATSFDKLSQISSRLKRKNKELIQSIHDSETKIKLIQEEKERLVKELSGKESQITELMSKQVYTY